MLREEVSVTIIQSRDHILNTFDTSISAYAEKKFDREKIKIVTNARVQKIDDNSVYYTVKNAGDPSNPETQQLPYGFCLWSTGICTFDFFFFLVVWLQFIVLVYFRVNTNLPRQFPTMDYVSYDSICSKPIGEIGGSEASKSFGDRWHFETQGYT